MEKGIINLCLMSLALLSTNVFSCQDGYYSKFGICLPNSGTVIERTNPVPDALNILGATVSGDVNALTQAIGGAVVKGSCPACAVLLEGKDKVFVEQVVGRGWLVFIATGDPALVVADAATNIANRILLGQEEPPVFSASPAKIREPIAYTTSEANCLVRHTATGKVTAGWADAPVLRADGLEKVYPNVNMLPVDTVKITSKNDCPPVPEGQERLSEIVINVNQSQAIPAEGTIMKYFFMGKAI
ncbi:hypothetical protein PssiTeo3_40420 [Pseudomonas sichuanensis]|nr:hypothetical protein [Pseudomonas sichuanensis]